MEPPPPPELRRAVKRKAVIGMSSLLTEVLRENGRGDDIFSNHDHSSDGYEDWHPVRLSPSIYMQMNCRVTNSLREILSASSGMARMTEYMEDSKTIFQLGSNNFSMHDHLSQLKGVGRLVYINNDENKLKKNTKKLSPPMKKRETPLLVQVYAGCITELDPNLMNAQRNNIFALLALNVVEFLDREPLSALVRNVFGVASPSVVIITTPNADYNVFFNLLPGTFRHKNHKFEWSRQEFMSWCHHVCEQHPLYSFTTEGIGEGPGTEDKGCVFQMAIFRKSDLSEDHEDEECMGASAYNESEIFEGFDQDKGYKLVHQADYPFHYDSSPVDKKIVKEFQSYTENYLLSPMNIEQYIQDDIFEIKLELDFVATLRGIPAATTSDEIRCALQGANYRIVDVDESTGRVTYIILPVPTTRAEDNCSSSKESESESESEEVLHSTNDYTNVNVEDEVW